MNTSYVPQFVRDEFYSAMRGRIRGQYSPSGKVEIMLPGASPSATLESTVIHENTHRYLIENTTFGFVHGMLYSLAEGTDGIPQSVRNAARDVIQFAEQESIFVHEGAATLRQYEWIRIQISAVAADEYISTMPVLYQSGYQAFRSAVENAAIEILSAGPVGLLLAEAALDTNVVDYLPDVLAGNTVRLIERMTSESPNRRFQHIVDCLARPDTRTRLRDVNDALRGKHSELPFPERSVEYGDAWAVLLKEFSAACELDIFGIDDYPGAFHRRLKEVTDTLEYEREALQMNSFRFALNLAPESHDDAWDWTLEREAEVHFTPDEFPFLDRAQEEQEPDAVLQWCSHWLDQMGPQSLFYVHIFLPLRLKALPIDLEYEEDADNVLILRPYSPERSMAAPDELIVRIKGGALLDFLLHPLLARRLAIAAALQDVYDELPAPSETELLLALNSGARARTIAELAAHDNFVFLYPRTNVLSYLRSLASALASLGMVQWGVIHSEHWQTFLIVLSPADSKYLIMTQSSDLAAVRFLEWAQEFGNHLSLVDTGVLIKDIPPHVVATFCSHFIRFGY